ncbi:bifunctional UDP-N-acetylmuramoyl-tripeptide:D-alanyl-D-alanine ligase/alanine racemase [Pelobium manganitolerans]|uniref:bifunctional UDP-N-acetylmuramoyl-tripeptide:D-alanyl-D-alanine ligase/alanine racemase n=1 Tax=Pelobium manganitolerans TaxID=1842495 RepID=UPI003FA356C6
MSQFSFTAEELSALVARKSQLNAPNQEIQHLLTDSRKITDAKSSVFFALKGSRDAHQYIPALYQAGVRTFIISDLSFNVTDFSEGNFIWVADTTLAMQEIAKAHRCKFAYPVIAVTGSNGKTIVKEWLYQLLAPDYDIVRSPKSYNSQIGVPLSVWQMSDDYNLAIFEAGISSGNEMQHLAAIIKPDIGVLTNIGAAHDEGFASRDEKLHEKLKLFKDARLVVINQQFKDALEPSKNTFTWSLNDETADLYVVKITHKISFTSIHAKYKNEEISVNIPFSSLASIENAVICWAVLLSQNVAQVQIEKRMQKLLQVKMRLELKTGINQSAIIDDSYNSDFSSLDIALDFLNQQNQYPTKTLILSDIHQSGKANDELYRDVAMLLTNKGVDRFIGIGADLKRFSSVFPVHSVFYNSTDQFIENFRSSDFKNETILLKGSRDFGFERISKMLTQKVHETVMEINLNAILANLKHYKAKLRPGVKLMAMVKAFAYGSGSDEIANLLQHHRVDYLAVAYADEGVALRQAGIKVPIMVLSPEVSSFESIVEHNLEPELYSPRILDAFVDFLNSKNAQFYPIHIKVDTGMHRLGFDFKDINALIVKLKTNTSVLVKSVFSHLVASDNDAHNSFTLKQISDFELFVNRLQSNLDYTFLRHILNTSGISRWPQAQFEMVRLGIGLYGIESIETEKALLEPVVSLKTTISQIKELEKGETVGYSRKGVMQHKGKTATVKIGYADGYPRALGNGVGKMLVNGVLAPTIGNICMDMTMLDISGIETSEGDDVIVFGEGFSVYELAEQLDTIPYEVITNISQRVKRVYYYE